MNQSKYTYFGESLYIYCKNNDIKYSSVMSQIRRAKKKETNLPDNILIAMAIRSVKKHQILYYYKGVPLKDYAKEHNLNIASIRAAILRKRQKEPHRPLEDIIDECVKTVKPFTIKYSINGVPLMDYIKEQGLNYNTVYFRIKKLQSENKDTPLEDIIKMVLDGIKDNKPERIKYSIDGKTLHSYCVDNNISYNNIYQRINTLRKRYPEEDINTLVRRAIIEYKKSKRRKYYKRIFNLINSGKVDDINKLRRMCDLLKLNFENMLDILQMGFSYKQAVGLLWHFADKIEDGLLECSYYRANRVLLLVNAIKEGKDLDKISLINIIKVHKCSLMNASDIILSRYEDYIHKLKFEYTCRCHLKYSKELYGVLDTEIRKYILGAIDNLVISSEGQAIKYIDMYTKGKLVTFIKGYSGSKELKFIPHKDKKEK